MEHEITLVGATIGSGLKNTSDLHVMKYEEAMRKKEIVEEKTKEKYMRRNEPEDEYEIEQDVLNEEEPTQEESLE